MAPAGIVEGFAVFAFVFALVLSGALPSVSSSEAASAASPIQQILTEALRG